MTLLSRFLAAQFARPSGWLGRHLIGPWLDRIGGRMNRLTLAEMRLARSDSVLEIGFGGGGLLALILERTSGPVTGVDVSKAMVDRARQRFGSVPRLRLLHGSVDSLPLEPASIDKACSVNNVYFWPDPARAVRELARIVRPGGSLSICFEPPEELRKWPGHRFGFGLYEEAQVEALMVAGGFGPVRRAEGRGRKPDHFLCLTAERLRDDAAA